MASVVLLMGNGAGSAVDWVASQPNLANHVIAAANPDCPSMVEIRDLSVGIHRATLYGNDKEWCLSWTVQEGKPTGVDSSHWTAVMAMDSDVPDENVWRGHTASCDPASCTKETDGRIGKFVGEWPAVENEISLKFEIFRFDVRTEYTLRSHTSSAYAKNAPLAELCPNRWDDPALLSDVGSGATNPALAGAILAGVVGLAGVAGSAMQFYDYCTDTETNTIYFEAPLTTGSTDKIAQASETIELAPTIDIQFVGGDFVGEDTWTAYEALTAPYDTGIHTIQLESKRAAEGGMTEYTGGQIVLDVVPTSVTQTSYERTPTSVEVFINAPLDPKEMLDYDAEFLGNVVLDWEAPDAIVPGLLITNTELNVFCDDRPNVTLDPDACAMIDFGQLCHDVTAGATPDPGSPPWSINNQMCWWQVCNGWYVGGQTWPPQIQQTLDDFDDSICDAPLPPLPDCQGADGGECDEPPCTSDLNAGLAPATLPDYWYCNVMVLEGTATSYFAGDDAEDRDRQDVAVLWKWAP